MEYLSQHISVEWLDEHRIILIRITNTARTDLDIYAIWLEKLLSTWDNRKDFLICYDLSLAALTPYSRYMATYVGDMMPTHLQGRTAIILIRGFLGALITNFFNRYVPLTNPQMKRQFFQDREEALAWLREEIQPKSPPDETNQHTY